MANGPRQVFLVVGSKDAGKTAYLLQLSRRARESGLQVGGILSLARLRRGKKDRYFLYDLRTGRQRLLAWRNFDPDSPVRIGSYAFDPTALNLGKQILRNCLDCDVILLDEYGPLEHRGGGFRSALEFLLDHFSGFLGISVRPALLNPLKELLRQRRSNIPE